MIYIPAQSNDPSCASPYCDIASICSFMTSTNNSTSTGYSNELQNLVDLSMYVVNMSWSSILFCSCYCHYRCSCCGCCCYCSSFNTTTTFTHHHYIRRNHHNHNSSYSIATAFSLSVIQYTFQAPTRGHMRRSVARRSRELGIQCPKPNQTMALPNLL